MRGTGGGGTRAEEAWTAEWGAFLPPPPRQRASDLRRLHPTARGAAPSVNPDPSPQGLGPSAPEEGVAGALKAKFEAGEAASGAPGFSGGAGAQMATQVEPLLPGGAPLLQAEEHGGLVRKKPPPPQPEGKGEPGANDVGGGEPDGGARRPRPPCAKPHKEGTGQLERESPRPPQPPGAEGLAISDGEEGGGGEPGAGGGAAGAAGAGRRDFVEAPPPKVNPWTKNALPPVLATVNGQSPPGGSPCLLSWIRGPLPGTCTSPPPAAFRARGSATGRGDSGFFFFFYLPPGSFGSRFPLTHWGSRPCRRAQPPGAHGHRLGLSG